MPKKKFNSVNNKKINCLLNMLVFVLILYNIFICIYLFTGLEMVMLNKLNLLYKFMKLIKKCDIIDLENWNYSPELFTFSIFTFLVQCIIRLILIIYYVICFIILLIQISELMTFKSLTKHQRKNLKWVLSSHWIKMCLFFCKFHKCIDININ